MHSLLTARKIVLMTLLLAVVALALTASVPRAEAIGGLFVCAYYSDATYTTVVGARGNGCCGTVINWGITTPYQKCDRILCTDQLCPNGPGGQV